MGSCTNYCNRCVGDAQTQFDTNVQGDRISESIHERSVDQPKGHHYMPQPENNYDYMR